MAYNKILVPHAGTLAGDKALEHAIKVAYDSKGKITLLHVIAPIPTPSGYTIRQHKEINDLVERLQNSMISEMDEKMKVTIKRLTEKEKGRQDIDIDYRIVIGIPEDEIEKFVKNDNYDVIVMAKRRKLPGIKAVLRLGSVSRKILEKVSIPILLIDAEG